jgi:tetratricopeptide (TPR) repeat protein
MTRRIWTAAVVAAGALALGACEEKAELPGSKDEAATSMPASHPAVPAPAAVATETDQKMALKLTGIGSKAELDRALAKIDDPEARSQFEMGFRACFVRDSGLRQYRQALSAMESVLQRMPDFAPAYRVQAYAKLNTGFDMAGATELYEKAVEADPEYGEAHYALSFMLTQFDPERGREHFERAMELGVEDERNLGEQFYP